jgi:hypothetical protein
MNDQAALFHMPAIAPDRPELHRYCGDCDGDVFELGERFMVRDEAWPIRPDGGVLCVGCLEARLGRRLTPEDFIDCGCNRPGRHSARLIARMGRRAREAP